MRKSTARFGGFAVACIGLTVWAACSASPSGDGTFTGAGAASSGTASSGSGSGSSNGSGGGLEFEGGTGDGAGQDGDACGSVPLIGKLTPGNIVVVFDQSDSMQQPFSTPDAGPGGPKWQVAEDALVSAVTPIENLLNLGAIFFPTKATGDTCSLVAKIGTKPQIPIEPASAFVTDYKGHFAAPGWTLILGTPLKIALDNANLALPDPSPLVGARAVLLITDGAPTCDTKAADILAPVDAMFSRGIKTYAVGLPGSAAASTLLNAIAAAGGTMKYLTPADPAALAAALAQIASDTIDKCTITLDPPPPDKNNVHLFVVDAGKPGAYEVPEVDGGDGWILSSDGKTATLTGAVCDKAKNGGYTKIDFVYGCAIAPK